MKKQILQLTFIALTVLMAISNQSNAQGSYWRIKGNTGTSDATDFIGTKDAQSLVFKTNNVERMRIFKGGKVGINIKNPKARLHVVSPDYVSLTGPGALMLGDEKGYNMALDINVIQARYNGTASPIYLNYYGGNTYLGPYGIVAISSTGVLTTSLAGINGSSNSSYALNVNASTSYNGINVTDGVDNYSLNATKSGLLAGVYVTKTSSSTVDACVWGNSSGSARGLQGNSGTGIGVYGSTNNSATYAGYFAGNVYTTGSYLPSDLTLKKDVKDFTKATDLINRLHPKIYQYKDDGNFKLMNLPKGDRYGLIAEDVEKVLPGLVKQSRFETATDADIKSGKATAPIDFKAVNYTELIPVMIKGMQEQQAVISQQQEQIDQLKELVQKMIASNSSDAKAAGVATGAYLIQNAPNPFSENTTVKCYVPSSVKQAQLSVYAMDGKLIKSYKLSGGMNNVNITTGSLPAGQYTYALLTDGKKVDAKNMVMTK